MRIYGHILLAFTLFLVNFILQLLTNQDKALAAIDRVHLHVITRVKPNYDSIKIMFKSSPLMKDTTCLMKTNLSDDNCLLNRQKLQADIVATTECNQHKSQFCSYVARLVSGFATRNVTNNWWSARDLSSSGTQMYDMIRRAGDLFHNSFIAKESNSLLIFRSVLFTIISACLLGNNLMTLVQSYDRDNNMPIPRIFFFGVITFIGVAGYAFTDTGSARILSILILPPLALLVWWEFLLPEVKTLTVHPFFFAEILGCLTILALTENGVRNERCVMTELIKSQAVGMAYMVIAYYYNVMHREWYPTLNAGVIFLTLTVVGLLGTQLLAPYHYTNDSVFMLYAPTIFAAISFLSVGLFQRVNVTDEVSHSGDDGKGARQRSSKLFCGNLLLAFGFAITLYVLSDHILVYRSDRDFWPTASIQFNPGLSFLMTGK